MRTGRSESRVGAVAKPGPEAGPGVAGGGGDKGEVGAQVRLGLRYRLSERIRQSPEAYAEFGNDTAGESAIPRSSSRAGCWLFVNRTRKVAELIPELYLHGLSEGDFDLALRGLLGEDAPVSASTVARLKSKRYPQKVCKRCTLSLNKTGSRPKRGDTPPRGRKALRVGRSQGRSGSSWRIGCEARSRGWSRSCWRRR